jgi:hypothetical protein
MKRACTLFIIYIYVYMFIVNKQQQNLTFGCVWGGGSFGGVVERGRLVGGREVGGGCSGKTEVWGGG